MENKKTNLILMVVLVLVIALASWQANRLDRLRTADTFFRWMISASNQIRIQGGRIPDRVQTADGQMRAAYDQEVFDAVEEAAQRILPDLALPETDELSGLPRIVQYATVPGLMLALDEDETQELRIERLELGREHRARLAQLWQLASSRDTKELRALFEQYHRDRQLAGIGSQFDILQAYSSQDTMVSLSNLFLGFRQMAANLLWLRSDKYWHQGQYYRMLPIMRTCVALDPHFVDAFLVGAWHLSYNATAAMPFTPLELRKYEPRFGERVGERERFIHYGIEFLKDGILKNPTDYRLYFDLGFAVYNEKLNDYENAVRYLLMANRQRHDKWVPRMLYKCMMLNEQYADALAGYTDYFSKHPESPTTERFIRYCRAYIEEQQSQEAANRIKEMNNQLERLHQQTQDAIAAGDMESAAQAQAEADRIEAEIAVYTSSKIEHRENAKRLWQDILEWQDGEDPLAEGRLARMEAFELVDQGRYREAILLLDYARYQTNDLWEEFSNLIIDLKIEWGQELTLTEKMALARRNLAEVLQDRHIGEAVFEFRDDGWYDETYHGQSLTPVTEGSEHLALLRESGAVDHLDEILSLARLREEYPDLRETIDLSNRVVFQVDDEWYIYQAV